MLYRVVEKYSSDTVEFQGKEFPSHCLVEDEDGIRLLLVPDHMPIPANYCASACDQGAQAIVSMSPLSCVLIEQYFEYRIEQGALYAFESSLWTPLDSLLPYAQMVLKAEEIPRRPPVTGFVHLHLHTDYSPLDGLTTLEEAALTVKELGQGAFAVTDHGMCPAHPGLQKVCDKYDLRPIFGIEAYFVDDRLHHPEDKYEYWHLVLWAMNDEGLRNIWAMSTESYRDGLYNKPRIDWSTLERHHEGVLVSTACLGGPLLSPWEKGQEEIALKNLFRLQTIFPGRTYIELHVNQMDKQIRGNKWLVHIAEEYNVPLVAVVDSHYARPADKQTHKDWISVRINKDIGETNLFEGNHDYHIMSEDEVRQALSYLPEDVVDASILNTAIIANLCSAEIRPNLRNPIYSRPSDEYPDRVQHDVDRLIDVCLGNWENRTAGKPHSQTHYMARFEHEMKLLVQKGFCGYFLMVWDLVAYAKRNGILVGPGRGSGVGSLVAYLSEITELDPVENGILFERFMTEGRTELPDFDIDFPSSKKAMMFTYAAERWGADNVATVGTETRLKNKGAINDTARALRDRLPDTVFMDLKKVSAIIDEVESHTAGLGVSWDELWVQAGDLLEPYREKYPYLFEVAGRFRSRLKSYGKHPAGIIIDPDTPLTGALPLRRGEDSVGMIAQFNLDALAALGFVKFDLLNIANLDIVQECVDLIEEQTGHRVNPYAWREEYQDPFVYDEMGEGWTLGLFQIGTTSGTRLVKRFRPRSIADLADVITLVRPGPMRSGLTETYFRRRNGEEEVTYQDPRLEAILSKTHGTILYQEDIMAVCMTLAGYDSNEADDVRKILGKKKVELVQTAGEKFIARAVDNDTDPSVAASIWDQMAEFAKYCVTGDTRISLAASGPASDGTVTVAELYHRLHSQLSAYANAGVSAGAVGRPLSVFEGPCVCCGASAKKYVRGYCANRCNAWLQKFKTKGLYALSYYADDRIRPARILDVVHNGNREVWKITLDDGKTITATSNHRHRVPGGYRTVLALEPGQELIVDDGYEAPTSQDISRRNRLTTGERKGIGAVNGHFGDSNYGYIDGGSTLWRRWRETHPQVCKQCGETANVQLAHLDGNHQNNTEDNFAWLCQSCHLKYDYARNDRRRRWEKGHRTKAVRIVSKEYVGVEPVYDVVMEAPHNFVANGIVTHNSFGRGHACAYAFLAHWTGWLKSHYPVQFLCKTLSHVKAERIPEFVEEARRMGYRVLPPDINDSQSGFTASGMVVRYGLAAVSGVGDAAVEAILSTRPYTSWEHFLEVKGPKCNMGHIKALVRIGAFDSLMPHRRALEQTIAFDGQPATDKCRFKDPTVNEFGLPCRYDWANEPPKLGRTNKPIKPKPPPKKCTKACRQYSPVDPPASDSVEPYTDADIRDIEMEFLGVYLSSTPFDRIDPEDKETLATAVDVLSGPNGSYTVAAVIRSQRGIISSNNKPMGFLSLTTECGELDVVVFNDWWQKYHDQFRTGVLCLVAVRKNDRGQSLDGFMSVDE